MNPHDSFTPALFSRRAFASALVAAAAAPILGSKAANQAKRWRVGVIGHTGRGGFGHSLDTMWLHLPEVEIVAVADPDEAGRAAALERLKIGNGFADYRRMLEDARPEIVAIAPIDIDGHRDMAVACAEAGVRGIYVEKPFCRTPAEADEIVRACQRSGTKVAVAHRNRWHPALPTVARLVADGAIGQFLEIRSRGKEDTRGGSLDLWILGSHLLDICRFFGGDPLFCSATVRDGGQLLERQDAREGSNGVGLLGGDEVHARFDLARGIPAFFDSVKNAGNRETGFGMQLIGTGGVIDLRMDKDPIAHFREGNPFDPKRRSGEWVPVTSAGIGEPEPIANCGRDVMGHRTGARDLIAAIEDGREPLCSASDGRAIVEMIAAVFQSHWANGGRIEFPLGHRGHPFAPPPIQGADFDRNSEGVSPVRARNSRASS